MCRLFALDIQIMRYLSLKYPAKKMLLLYHRLCNCKKMLLLYHRPNLESKWNILSAMHELLHRRLFCISFFTITDWWFVVVLLDNKVMFIDSLSVGKILWRAIKQGTPVLPATNVIVTTMTLYQGQHLR